MGNMRTTTGCSAGPWVTCAPLLSSTGQVGRGPDILGSPKTKPPCRDHCGQEGGRHHQGRAGPAEDGHHLGNFHHSLRAIFVPSSAIFRIHRGKKSEKSHLSFIPLFQPIGLAVMVAGVWIFNDMIIMPFVRRFILKSE